MHKLVFAYLYLHDVTIQNDRMNEWIHRRLTPVHAQWKLFSHIYLRCTCSLLRGPERAAAIAVASPCVLAPFIASSSGQRLMCTKAGRKAMGGSIVAEEPALARWVAVGPELPLSNT